MKHSDERILTTHVGSLPRNPLLTDLLIRDEAGDSIGQLDLSVLRLPRVSDLWTTGYGHVLLVKLSLVALALAWGAAHRFLAAPRVSAGSGFPSRTPARILRYVRNTYLGIGRWNDMMFITWPSI